MRFEKTSGDGKKERRIVEFSFHALLISLHLCQFIGFIEGFCGLITKNSVEGEKEVETYGDDIATITWTMGFWV